MTKLAMLTLLRGKSQTLVEVVEDSIADGAFVITNSEKNLSHQRISSTSCSLARNHNIVNREVDKDSDNSKGNIIRMQTKENFYSASLAQFFYS